MVRASSARFSSESGSAHSCVLSPKPFGACGDQIGCRSCRSTGIVVSLISCASSARSTATSQSCGVRNFRAPSLHASGRSTSAADTARRSPSVSRKTRAMRSIADARRRVAHKMGDELRRQESRGRWMTHERANDALALFDAAFGVSRSKHRLRSRLVQELLKRKSDAAVGVGLRSHGPARRWSTWSASALRCHRLRRCIEERPRPPTVQPVRIFASSCTSCWV